MVHRVVVFHQEKSTHSDDEEKCDAGACMRRSPPPLAIEGERHDLRKVAQVEAAFAQLDATARKEWRACEAARLDHANSGSSGKALRAVRAPAIQGGTGTTLDGDARAEWDALGENPDNCPPGTSTQK